MRMLANITDVPADGLKDWLIVLAALMGLLLLALHLWSALKGGAKLIGPSPFIVSGAIEHARKDEFMALARRVDRIETRIEKQHEELMTSAAAREDRIHERINLVLSAVSELTGRMNQNDANRRGAQ